MNPTNQESNAVKVETAAQSLGDRLAGRVVLPGSEGWDLARQAWNRAVDQRPAAVALPESAQDVLAAVEYAQAHSLAVAPQGTGHGALPLGMLDETALLNTARMRGVQIDPVARRAGPGRGAVGRGGASFGRAWARRAGYVEVACEELMESNRDVSQGQQEFRPGGARGRSGWPRL